MGLASMIIPVLVVLLFIVFVLEGCFGVIDNFVDFIRTLEATK